MGPIIIREKMSKDLLLELCEEYFDDMAKVAVDIDQKIVAVGGEWHAFGQEILVSDAMSNGESIWGANVYPNKEGKDAIEYISLINIKPSLGAKDMHIRDTIVRDAVRDVIEKFILWQ